MKLQSQSAHCFRDGCFGGWAKAFCCCHGGCFFPLQSSSSRNFFFYRVVLWGALSAWWVSPLVSLVLAASPCGDCDSGEKLRLKDQVGSVNLSALIGPSAIIMSSVRFTYISLSDCHMFMCVCVCVCVCLIPSGTESIYCKWFMCKILKELKK